MIALQHGKDVCGACREAEDRFAKAVYSRNQSGEIDFSISVAYGAAFCDGITAQSLDALEKEADQKMYQNKYQLKFADAPFSLSEAGDKE